MTAWTPPPRKISPLLVQTWPYRVPDHRSYAFNHQALNVPIGQHDCRPVLEILKKSRAPGVLMIEWDIALDGDDLRTICRRAIEHPDEGFVAPYKLWPGPTWCHRIIYPTSDRELTYDECQERITWIQPDDPACNLPGFGCIYLPRPILEAWEPAPHDPRLTDSNFAWWAQQQDLWWPILWDIHPVHLHY